MKDIINEIMKQCDITHVGVVQCATVKADTSWKGGQVHRDDIISVAHCPPTLLATASFDGEICVWSTETQLLIVRLRRPSKCSK